MLSVIDTNAQKSHKDSVYNSPNWIINVFGSPDYTYRLVYHTSGSSGVSESTDLWSYKTNDQIGKLGYHFGFTLSKKIFKNIYLQTGLVFDKKGYNSTTFYDTIIYGNPTQIEIKKRTIQFDHIFLGIPIFINYDRKIINYFYCGLTIGATSNFFWKIKEYREMQLDGESVYNNEKIQDWPLIGYGKVNFSYRFLPDGAISLSPFFNVGIQPINDYYSQDCKYNNLHLYSTGIEIGLHFNLGKK